MTGCKLSVSAAEVLLRCWTCFYCVVDLSLGQSRELEQEIRDTPATDKIESLKLKLLISCSLLCWCLWTGNV